MEIAMNGPHSRSSRREFLRVAASTVAASTVAASTVAASTVAAPLLALDKKTDSKRVVIGDGEHRYECHHGWGTLPDGHEYGGASHGVAIDAAGHVYVTHHGRPGSIFVFDPDGKFVRSMGERFMEGKKKHGVGHGIDIRKDGGEEFLYLSPDNDSFGFAKMSLGGELVWQKDRAAIAKDSGLYGAPKARFRATNLNFAPDGGYFLGDGYGSGYIHRYDKDDKYVSSFGGAGQDDGKFRTPHGQWLDERDGTPKVVVCDRANKRLQFFDLEGKFLSKLDGFLFPADIDIRGELMLVPDLHCRITILDKKNRPLVQLGDDAEWRAKALDGFKMRGQPASWKPGRFIHPHDACFDKDGNIFVAEWVRTGRVTKLRKVS